MSGEGTDLGQHTGVHRKTSVLGLGRKFGESAWERRCLSYINDSLKTEAIDKIRDSEVFFSIMA